MRNRDLLYNVISQPSIVSSEEEKKFGFFLHAYTSSLPCWDEVEAWKDAEGRVSVLSFRKGSSSSCVLLLGHYDTVGVDDYPEKAVAFEPEKAKKWMIAEAGVPPEIRQGLEKGEWVAGRGSLDMKAGIVSQLSFVEEHCPEDVTVLCLWVPDEEGYSAGARFAFPRLFHFLQSHSLRLKWVIKSDFTHIKGAIYSGSTGKCLLNAYIRTKSGHIAGGNLAFNALFYAAEVIRYGTQFSRPDLSVTPLFLQTLPAGYTVQTPFECWVNLNMLFFRQSLQERLGIWYRRLSRQFGEGFITWVDAREKVPPKGSLRERALEIIRGK
ncbi:MAG: M20/M25/M40 family metallo-hydrolase, partial [bacterium]